MTHTQKNNWLGDFRRSVATQHGEDGVLEQVFKTIGVDDARAWCVEFGAGDGAKDNTNTWNLIHNRSWSAVLIEADPVYFENLPKNYAGKKNVFCLNERIAFSGEHSLDAVLEQTPIPKDFDFLCIDIDGNDYHVWKSVQEYQPKVVMIEYNGRIPVDIEFIQPRDMSIGWGSSLASIAALGKQKGYELVYAHVCNAVFVRNDVFPSFRISDNSPAALAGDESPNTRFFQLYDGTIVLIGCERNKLLCHKKKVRKDPVWVMDSGGFFPVTFHRDSRLVRAVKSAVKNSFVYPLLYPMVRAFYDHLWEKRRRFLKESKNRQSRI